MPSYELPERVERFEPKIGTDERGEVWSQIKAEPDGEWVRYSDYESAEMARATERIGREEAETQRDQVRQEVLEEVEAIFACQPERVFTGREAAQFGKRELGKFLATLDPSGEQGEEGDWPSEIRLGREPSGRFVFPSDLFRCPPGEAKTRRYVPATDTSKEEQSDGE